MPNTSIAITVKDEASSSLNSIRVILKSLGVESKGAAKDMNQLQESGVKLQADARRLTGSLENTSDALQKVSGALGGKDNPFAKVNLNKTREEFRGLQNELLGISGGAKEAQKQLLTLGDEQSKTQSRASKFSSLATKLAPMVTEALDKQIKVHNISKYGKSEGNLLTSILSGTLSGGITGFFEGNIPGAIIGGVVGAISGAISGEADEFEEEDNAFKDYTNNEYDKIREKQNGYIKNGSSIAAEREHYSLKFKTLLGDDEKVKKLESSITDFTRATSLSMATVEQGAYTLLNFGVNEDSVMETIKELGDVSQGDSSQFEMLIKAFAQISSTGKLTEQELNQFKSIGFDPLAEIAKKTGKSMEELQERMSQGRISVNDMANALSAATSQNGRFYQSLEKQAETYSGISSRLSELEKNVMAAAGKGYNDEMIKVKQKQVEFLEGKSGIRYQDAYNQIGRYQAEMEGKQVEYEIGAFDFIMDPTKELSDLYKTPENAETAQQLKQLQIDYAKATLFHEDEKLQSILAEAQNIADNAYHADTGTQSELQIQIDLLQAIKDNTAANPLYWNSEYIWGQEKSKGLDSTGSKDSTISYRVSILEGSLFRDWNTDKYNGREAGVSFDDFLFRRGIEVPNYDSSSAMGIPYIPRDDYLIRAHEGERLLTADEARRYNAGGSGTQVLVTMNGVTVREEADIDKVANELAWQIHKQQMIGVAT